MKRTIRAILLIGALASVADASPACVTGTMADYLALLTSGPNMGCTISDKLFSSFNYGFTATGNGVAVIPTNVTVIPDFSDPLNPGFHFRSSGWTVFSLATDNFTSSVDSSIGFTVQTVNGQPLLDDNTLTLDAGMYTATNLAFGDIAETLNPGGIQFGVDTGGPFFDHKTFVPRSLVVVTKDLQVAAEPFSNSNASITQFSENFSELGAPEPAEFLLIGSGLIGVAFFRRRS